MPMSGDHHHLQQMDPQDGPAGGAEALEGGDDLAAAIDVGGDRVGDADAADQQRGEPDQRQELPQPLERARHLRGGIAPVAHREAAFGQRLLDALAETDEAVVRLAGGAAELEGVAPADQAARIDQAGRLHGLERHQHARADGEALGQLVGLGGDGGADRHLDLAEGDAIADLEPQALEQDRIDGGAGLAADGVVQRHVAGEAHGADQRIGRVHALELDQGLLGAVGLPRHGAHGGGFADAALLPQPVPLLALGRPVRARQGHVAAQQRLALALEARSQRIGERADAGDDGNAQRHAGDEDVEAPEAVALLAQRQAQRQRQSAEQRPPRLETGDRDRHAGASSLPAISPSAMRTMRPQRSASFEIVGDENQGRLAAALQAEQQIDHLLAGLAVEVAGRLVGEDDLRAGAQRAGDGDALLLAAGELRREVVGAMGQAHLGEHGAGRLEGVGLAGELQRQGHVLQRRHGRHQMERLEDDADVAAADDGKLVLAQPHEIVAGDPHLARGRPLQAGDHHQQGGLARAARADHGNQLAGRDLDIDSPQNLHGAGATGERQRDVAQIDDRFGHDRNRLLPGACLGLCKFLRQ